MTAAAPGSLEIVTNQEPKETAVSKKSYRKKTSRSRRRARKPKGRVVSVEGEELQLALPVPQLLAAAHGAVEALAGEAGLLIMKALIDEEVEQLVGPRYRHDGDRQARRWGSEEGYVVFGGKKAPMKRPRVRAVDGGEVPLQRYGMFQSDARMQGSVSERVLRGVSTRDYEGVIEDVCDGYGIRKSSVSRQWKAATAKQLTELMERPLDDLDLVAIMIDGIHFHEFTLIAALGVDSEGRKHVLGIWDGATENGSVVKSLLESLVERGLDSERRHLFVIDGSKALRKGITSVFGNRAIIQRCQVHKERNVLDHLPEGHQATTRRALRAAWGMRSYKDAMHALKKLLRMLDSVSPGAAASLREGLEETLTLHRLEVPPELRRSLRTTNPIESIFARTRELCRNVKRWSSADMALRWATTMLLYAEKKFRRIFGYKAMPKLDQALTKLDKKEGVA
jgi:transposase-like protein